jgi:hypothetical protein
MPLPAAGRLPPNFPAFETVLKFSWNREEFGQKSLAVSKSLQYSELRCFRSCALRVGFGVERWGMGASQSAAGAVACVLQGWLRCVVRLSDNPRELIPYAAASATKERIQFPKRSFLK